MHPISSIIPPSSIFLPTRMIECHRPKNAISELRGESAVESKGAMVDFQYEISHQLDTTMQIKVQNLLIILNVEYIMVLLKVFWSAMPQTTPEEETDKASLPPTPTHSVTADEKRTTSAISSGAQVAMAVENVPLEHVPEMKVTIDVKNPQIVILADSQDKNTNALFLDVSSFQNLLEYSYFPFIFNKSVKNCESMAQENGIKFTI